MKYYLIIFISTNKSSPVITKGLYKSKNDADIHLVNSAIEYVKLDGGERQEKIAFQNDKTLEQIKNDTSLNFGIYLKEFTFENGEKIIEVYEKTIKDTGVVRSYMENFIENKGVFCITSVDFDISQNCDIQKNTINFEKSKPSTDIAFIDELKNFIKKGKYSLKPVTDRNFNNTESTKITNFIDEIKYIASTGKGFGLNSV